MPAFGCDPSELCLDCIVFLIDPQSKGLIHNPGASRGLQRNPWTRVLGWGLGPQFRRNRSGHKSDPIGAQSVPIASGLPKIPNPVAIVRIANIEVSIAGGLRQSERALFGDCGAPRGLQRIPEQPSGPALESGLKPDGQPLG